MKRSSHECANRSPCARQVSRNSRVSEAVASISAITLSAPSTNATAPSPVVCSALPSGAARRQSPIATSARFAPPLTASAPCSIADMPARTEPVISDARISAGNCVAAPITAALSFSAYGGVVVAKISACTSPGLAALHRVARRLDRHRDAVFVEARDRALALAGGSAEHRRDRRAFESSVGNV